MWPQQTLNKIIVGHRASKKSHLSDQHLVCYVHANVDLKCICCLDTAVAWTMGLTHLETKCGLHLFLWTFSVQFSSMAFHQYKTIGE